MKDIPLGLAHTTRHTVTTDGSAPHLSVPVLATPTMISMIEYCCIVAAQDYMDEGETSVGAHVCVSHEKPTFVDEEYVISCVLTAIDGRRLTFEVKVENERGLVSQGTHQRGVVDFSKFG
jgi:predicted thioesterase